MRFVATILSTWLTGGILAGADLVPPAIISVTPPPGCTTTGLVQLSVVFSEPIRGIQAADLRINGRPATNVTGTDTAFAFSFPPPAPGWVGISWDTSAAIADLAGNCLDSRTLGSNWQYLLLDTLPPVLSEISPLPEAVVGSLTEVVVLFSEPVEGIDAADLLLNGQPALSVLGTGAGPYRFDFAAGAPGTAPMRWAASHGIHDKATPANPFPPPEWNYVVQPSVATAEVVITEFLAAATGSEGLQDEDGDASDWIEIQNRSPFAVNLAGWSLSDDASNPNLWVFPSFNLEPGQYRVVFASGKNRRPADGHPLHTNFKLSATGEYLGLFDAGLPRRARSEFSPRFPEQRASISYGQTSNSFSYFFRPTPGTANQGATLFAGVVAAPKASVSSGFFRQPFAVSLTTTTPEAIIRFTLDGSEPTATSGIFYTGLVEVVASPSRAVINLRAVALRSGYLASHVSTWSYFFPDHVLTQPAAPEGWPTNWTTADGFVSVAADYEMDPQVLTNAAYAEGVRQALTNLPTLSLVMNADDLFSQTRGIYSNPSPPPATDAAWERPLSAELVFPDGRRGFQMNAGVRLQGGSSRDANRTSKHSLRLFFRDDYGNGTLEHPLFPDSAAGRFDTLILDAGLNHTWHYRPTTTQRTQAQYVRDLFVSDLHHATGHPSPHGRFVNLYLNGLFWGLYNLHERPDADFAATYFGGDKADYDVVRNTDGFEVLQGDSVAWTAMMALANPGLSDNAQYEQLQQYLDVPALIDYMIVNIYAGNTDWPTHNWYAFRQRAPGAGFQFAVWDAEWTLLDPNENVSGVNVANTPAQLYAYLRNNDEFRLQFADRVQRHFFNGGTFFVDTNHPAVDPQHPERNRPAALYLNRIAEIDPAIILESARWGDNAPGSENRPHTRDNEWLAELNRLRTSYFPQRSRIVLDQFRMGGLYPGMFGTPAPAFNRHGGAVTCGFNLTMTAPKGVMYFTTDGSDPRDYGTGAVSSRATAYTAGQPLVLNTSTVIRARALQGSVWSPLSEAYFAIGELTVPIRITELSYNPVGGEAYEFLELQNIGATPIDLSGFSFEGFTFNFPVGSTLPTGAVLILANAANTNAFAARYPGVAVGGCFSGNLSNGGERIALKDPANRTVISVTYSDDAPWPTAADGGGATLEMLDVYGDPNDPANWRASTVTHGTPGSVSPLSPPGAVVLNEVMADNVSAVNHQGAFPDWIELHNQSTTAVSLAGWRLAEGANPVQFVFPTNTVLAADSFLVVWCDTLTNSPGLHTGFALDRQGESLFLFDAASTRVDALTYGQQAGDYSVGRIQDGWQLTTPTPAVANQAAELANPTNLVINEWLSNPLAGQSDWLELYNRSSQSPVALHGLYLGTSNALFQFTALSFIAPLGCLELFADERAGANHLDFKLPATGGLLALYDPAGEVLDQIIHGPQLENVSQGRLPDGGSAIVSFPGTATPGAANALPSYSGPRLNEVLAANRRASVDGSGRTADWIELHNPNDAAADLSGQSLSVDSVDPGQWSFPAGAAISAHGYLVIWCAATRPPSSVLEPDLNTGRSLSSEGGSVHVFNAAGQLVDSVEYGFQIPDQSIGRLEDGWHLLVAPSPGRTNAAAALLGQPDSVRFNEWMANPVSGDDWFELYNLDARPVEMSGLLLSDDPSIAGITKQVIGPLSFIASHRCVKWIADSAPGKGSPHVNYSLSAAGESLRLYMANGDWIDGVDFGPQDAGRSQGRLPDGIGGLTSFANTVSPGEGNYLPLTNVVINEVLTAAEPPFFNGIELHNPRQTPVDIGGWFLTDDHSAPKKFRIPPGTVIPANGFRVFTEPEMNAGTNLLSFVTLDAHGGEIGLWAADLDGTLAGSSVSVHFGAAALGVSLGRYCTSTGEEFVALRTPTFRTDGPAPASQPERNSGATNAGPLVGPIVINEIMYHPITGTGPGASEPPAEEYLELLNISANTVPLVDPAHGSNSWSISGAVEFSFPPGLSLPPSGTVLVVGFDPATDSAALATFRTKFAVNAGVPVVGPFHGRLDNSGESVDLLRPGTPLGAGDDCPGFVPSILVDRVTYSPDAPWPVAANGSGASLQRRDAALYGNDVVNWMAGAPSAGQTNNLAAQLPPTVTSQLIPLTVAWGETATLIVTAVGEAPLRYQWEFNGTPVFHATNRTLVLSQVDLRHAGVYRVRVSNNVGATFGDAMDLAVVIADADGDGMPDAWETARGLNPTNAADALTDADGDGMSNLQEFLAGTNPGDPASGLKLDVLKPVLGGGTVLRFSAMPGRSYTVQYRDGFGSVWQRLADIGEGAEIRSIELTDPIPEATTSRFYRVLTPAAP